MRVTDDRMEEAVLYGVARIREMATPHLSIVADEVAYLLDMTHTDGKRAAIRAWRAVLDESRSRGGAS